MKYRQHSKWLAAALSLFSLAAPAPAQPRPAAGTGPQPVKALIVKVGIISYDNFSKGVKNYQPLLRELSRLYNQKTGEKVVFELAVGSYSDVLEWYNRESVHIAFLTPQPLAELRASLGDAELDNRYLASHATNNYLTHARNAAEMPVFEYRSACVVAADSPINDAAGLKEYAARGALNFLFVDPLSASGRILPEYVLRSDAHPYRITNFAAGRAAEGQNGTTYTYSRDESLAALRAQAVVLEEDTAGEQLQLAALEKMEKQNVAFVYDGPDLGDFKRIPIPELDAARIPEQVLLVAPSFLANKKKLETIFDVNNARSYFQKNPYPDYDRWYKRFDEVGNWVKTLKVSSRDRRNQMFTLERIGSIVRRHEFHHGTPARLALVLSGGGAKCAYQLGAIQAIESEVSFKEPDESKGERKVDIDLVVGTSGGAINALTVALGLTRAGDDAKFVASNTQVEDAWKSFKQTDFFSPWPIAYYLMALCSALIQAVLVIWAVILVVSVGRRRWPDIKQLYRYLGFFMIGVALVDLLVQLSVGEVTFGTNHMWWHLWLLLTFDLYLSAVGLIVLGLYLLYRLYRSDDPAASLHSPHLLLRNLLLCAVGVVLAYSVMYQKTLSNSDRVQSTLAQKIAQLLGPEAEADLEAARAKKDDSVLASLTNGYVTGRLERDLVITGSILDVRDPGQSADADADADLPSNIYFYHDHEKFAAAKDDPKLAPCDPAPPRDNRNQFHKFNQYLLDVVVGSGSIYPIFPSRDLTGFRAGSPVKIIDGGFAHNSPIEAAVNWKATHIILIEASPNPPKYESPHLWGNALNAFNHLYDQAQQLDARARGEVEIFTLRPEAAQRDDPPDMCTFDFTHDSISRAIARGRNDAQDEEQSRFERKQGEPVFRVVSFENTAEERVDCSGGQ